MPTKHSTNELVRTIDKLVGDLNYEASTTLVGEDALNDYQRGMGDAARLRAQQISQTRAAIQGAIDEHRKHIENRNGDERHQLAHVVRGAIGTPPAGHDFFDAADDIQEWMTEHRYVRLDDGLLEQIVEAVRDRAGDDAVAALHAAKHVLGFPV